MTRRTRMRTVVALLAACAVACAAAAPVVDAAGESGSTHAESPPPPPGAAPPGCSSLAKLFVDPACGLLRGSRGPSSAGGEGAAGELTLLPGGGVMSVALPGDGTGAGHPLLPQPAAGREAAVLLVRVLKGNPSCLVAGLASAHGADGGAGGGAAFPAPASSADGGELRWDLPTGVPAPLLLTLACEGAPDSPPAVVRLSLEDAAEMDAQPGGGDGGGSGHGVAGGPPGAPQVLVDGVVVRDGVGRLAWTYYSIDVPTPLTRVEVVCTSTAGDADLFVNIDGTPPDTNAQYRATGMTGPDKVLIVANDSFVPTFCPGPAPCHVVIGVRGWSAANFTIVATSGGNGTTALAPGVPASGQLVPAGAYKYYTLAGPNVNATISVVVTPTGGDPDLYVGSTRAGAPRPRRDDPTTYCASSSTTQREVVEIFSSDPCFCGATPGCQYYIGVFAYGASPAAFSVLGQSLNPPVGVLLDGTPQFGVTGQGATSQYTFATELNATAGIKSVDVRLTSFYGEADLFIALDGLPATASHAQFRSPRGSGQTEAIVIRYDNAIYRQYCGAAYAAGVACSFNVGVRARTAAIWSLTAASAFYVTLSDGVPQGGAASAGVYDYYVFPLVRPNTGVVLSLTPSAGDPDVYVGCDSNPNTTQPTNERGRYLWRSSNVGVETVVIQATDPKLCAPPCALYVGVTGYLRNATFSLLARTRDATPVQLAMGQPVTDTVASGEYAYYTALWDWSSGVMYVQVQAVYGDSDVYAALNGTMPSIGFSQYSSTSSDAVELLTIRSTDAAFTTGPCAAGDSGATNVTCVVSIAVYGFTPSAYSITAWSSLRSLEDGLPVTAVVDASQMDYFVFQVPDRGTPVSLFVTPLDAGDP